MDALLQQPAAVQDCDPVQEECKDYLKMLHTIVTGEWTTEALPEDDTVLLAHCEGLVQRLVKCIARSFDLPAKDSQAGAAFATNGNLGLDVSLLAISLSALFAFVKRLDVAQKLSEKSLFEVFHECLRRICDPRITQLVQKSGAMGVESKETATQVVRALNMIILKLGMDGSVGAVLIVLLRIMFCCIPTSELPANIDDHRPLPSGSTKPASRLVIQILSEQGNRVSPFAEPEIQMPRLLEAVHSFFTRHPTSTADDTPFRTAKTILNEVIRIRGGHHILKLLQETPIPRTSFIYLLTCRLGNVKMVETDPALDATIVAVIDEITSARDKLAPIGKLHQIKLANPQVDINLYLLKVSAAFRRYVTTKLAQLDEAAAGANAGAGPSANAENVAAKSNTIHASNSSNSTSGGDAPTGASSSSPTSSKVAGTPAAHRVARTPPATATATGTATASASLAKAAKQGMTSATSRSPQGTPANDPGSSSRSSSSIQGTPAPSEYSSARSTPLTSGSTGGHVYSSGGVSGVPGAAPAHDPAYEALRILEGIKQRPSQMGAGSIPPEVEQQQQAEEGSGGGSATSFNSYRSYSLEYSASEEDLLAAGTAAAAAAAPAAAGASGATAAHTPGASASASASRSGAGSGTGGKHKRFAFNPETKRMEILMFDTSEEAATAL
jgi:hypothetical protein